jgi:hypothetical protein
MHLPAHALLRFTSLGNATALDVVDTKLRQLYFFDSLSLAGRPGNMAKLGPNAEEHGEGARREN